jgi:hypothetical protein
MDSTERGDNAREFREIAALMQQAVNPIAPVVAEVRITRSQLVPTPGRGYRAAWKWTYCYSVDGAPVLQFGTGLADLRSLLRRKYPTAKIIKNWEQ